MFTFQMNVMRIIFAVVLCVAFSSAQETTTNAEPGQLVRPKSSGRSGPPEPVSKCSEETWDSVQEISRYSSWKLEDFASASGFTVMINLWTHTVSSQCFQTKFKYSSEHVFSVTNVHTTQPTKTFHYDMDQNSTTSETPSPKPTDASPKLMIVGGSPNFVVYVMCNEKSSHLSIFVSYNSSITDEEKREINKWIKASNFPVLGRFAAINFDTCYFTKTYICNGGNSQYCSGVKKQPRTIFASEESSEESGDPFAAWG